MRKNVILFLVIFLIGLSTPSYSQFYEKPKRASVALEHGAHRLGRRTDAMMETWRNYGLGQFIHWGVYAIPGGQWSGKAYPGAAEWIRAWNEMPRDEYDQLYKQFNPKDFDAKKWALQAKEMGAKYMLITTKHHDGFCLWPSKYTDYTIENSPYKKDIVGDLVKAYTAEGIDVYLYFSIIDWNHPGYRSKIKSDDERPAYEEFKQFTRNQLVELLDLYPETKGLWFDGTWDKAWVEQAEFADELGKELRSMIPGLIIGSRFRADEKGNRHFDANGDMMGDYEQGWERKIPANIDVLNGNDWDCVMTIPENQWGYNSNWKGHVKSSNELLEMLIRCVSMDGNFVLNFGPDGLGNIRPEETERAADIGKWMKKKGEAIHDCGYAGLDEQNWGYFTKSRTNGKTYLLVTNVPVTGGLTVKVPKDKEIAKVYPLASPNQSLKLEKTGKYDYFVRLNEKNTDSIAVFVLEYKGDGESGSDNFQEPKI